MKNVKVIIWGLGAMGGGIAKMLTKKKGVDIVGAIDIGAKLGKSMYEVIPGIERGDREDVIVGTPEEVIKEGAADIVVVCTNSFTRDVFDKLVFVMEKGMNVITSAEEMALAAEGKNPLSIDSAAPTESYRDFIMGEVRYNSLGLKFPERAEKLFEEGEEVALDRYKTLKHRQDSFEK